MGFKDLFKKKQPPKPDPLKDLTLSNLKKGYFVDYDLKTWEVTAANYYDFGQGDVTREWQLKNEEETVYLEMESDDEEFWSLNRKIPFGRLGPGLKDHILEHEDPPEEIVFDSVTFYLDETGGGHYFKDEQGPGQEFIRWSYRDDSGKKLLDIEQWGETDFEASVGERVEEYQFTNILPREE
ncbi:MAG: DUF4178 domain-containing protein [Deltaproteobacteria bacterium]|nr:DUF4178 domain-containing protein [Deltaproteobacteria bacterium]